MLRGTVEVLTDSASKEMIWEDGDTMYYKEGVTDPDYCVLKFTATSGRFYSNFKSESLLWCNYVLLGRYQISSNA